MLCLRTRFLARCTAIALVAILAGQIAVAGHAAAADHGVGEQCDVCVGGDRLAHGLSPAAAELPAVPATPAVTVPVATGHCVFPPRHGHARAPPHL
ncbi:hypothetical protein [Lentisalinibacter sediminis]|uniref:hypothetical protein n=1 Tax=Lentisalinibacter sediminis TaxID=2992237 RepID=UPI003864D014